MFNIKTLTFTFHHYWGGGGFLSVDFCPRGAFVRRAFVRGAFVRGGFCPRPLSSPTYMN